MDAGEPQGPQTNTNLPSVSFANALLPLDGPELIFGLVAPTGTPVDVVCAALESALSGVKYACEVISLSELIEDVTPSGPQTLHADDRIRHLMRAGTSLRKAADRRDIVALLAVSAIRDIRERKNKATGSIGAASPADKPIQRMAYVLRSLKTPEEVEALRNIYGEAFLLISLYSTEEEQVQNLSRRICDSRHASDPHQFTPTAYELINADREDGIPYGQRVRDTFPLADFFLRYGQLADMEKEFRRFISLLFGNSFITPTRDEYGMFLARAVAMRSADLGRQVGAVIATNDGDVVAVGCNEVPKFGGGQYWANDPNDHRDFKLGEDAAVATKRRALIELLDRLSPMLSSNSFPNGIEKAADALLTQSAPIALKSTLAMSSLEYGRAVHAEMAAISDAARRGVAVAGGTLFSTTFPCHLCARHIVACGLTRVVYIEPYPKSKTEELYHDSIIVNPTADTRNKVSFEPFVGVSPTKYFDFFSMARRKNEQGMVESWDAKAVKNPKLKTFVASSLMVEQKVMNVIVSPFLNSRGDSDVKKVEPAQTG